VRVGVDADRSLDCCLPDASSLKPTAPSKVFLGPYPVHESSSLKTPLSAFFYLLSPPSLPAHFKFGETHY